MKPMDGRPVAEHDCSEFKCRTCGLFVNVMHKCYIGKPKKLEEVDGDPRVYGQRFYVFDVESSFTTTAAEDMFKHTVNFICVRRCFTDDEWTFQTLGEFINWLTTIEEPCTMFAHNFKGYDGRMLFDAFVAKNCQVPGVMKRGSKFLSFTYGKIKFQDTLLHITASLDQMPKMFGMDTATMKKGFFPYLFNTPENIDYVGAVPSREFFQPEMMKAAKYAEFEKWYAAQRGVVYNFREELELYCKQDVNILRHAVETYFLTGLQSAPLDPWSCMTIASYASTVYRAYHMPANTIAVESNQRCQEVRQALHGGRVDVRRMLREWSSEEVANAVFGRYQDVQSLYPWVQFTQAMPVGHGVKTSYADGDPVPDLTDFFGIIKCDIQPTKYVHHPVLVELKDGKLQADFYPKIGLTITSAELHAALKVDYVVTRVYFTIAYEQSTELFKSYFKHYIKSKIESSGMPSWVKTDADWQEFHDHILAKQGMDLKREDMVKNNSKKTVDKLMCNSLWGKFAETAKPCKSVQFDLTTQISEYIAFQFRWQKGEIEVVYFTRSANVKLLNIDYRETCDDLTP